MITASEIDDFSTGILLRHLKGITSITPGSPRIDKRRDIDFIKLHWSISSSVRYLANYLIENRHETQSLLAFRKRTDDVMARGRIDARSTVLERYKTGLPTMVVSAEPIRSFSTGPNQILAWVINQAWQLAYRFASVTTEGSVYKQNADQVVHLLGQVRRIDVIGSILNEISVSRRPLPASLITAQRSRRKLYRLAYEAYQSYVALEAGNEIVIRAILKDTLLVPIENWRRLELAVALSVGEALAQVTGSDLQLEILGLQPRSPILRCGDYAMYWQTLTELYTPPIPEPSELTVQTILHAYGLNSSSDRPDLLVINEKTQELISIIEVKFHGGDSPAARFKEAAYQIVRYARGYASNPAAIIERSAIAMNVGVPELLDESSAAPFAFSFNDVKEGKLVQWIKAKWLV
jgi:hypothetical protein